jgi:hypothetical protein
LARKLLLVGTWYTNSLRNQFVFSQTTKQTNLDKKNFDAQTAYKLVPFFHLYIIFPIISEEHYHKFVLAIKIKHWQ